MGDTNRGLIDRLVRGREDTRLRASIRVLFAMPLYLGSLTAAGLLVSLLELQVRALVGTVVVITIGTAIFGGLFGLFSRYIDRRSLRAYGLPLDTGTLRDVGLGFAALATGTLLWAGIANLTGVMAVSAEFSYSEGPFLPFAVLMIGLSILGALVQQLAYLGIIFYSSIEGFVSRGASSITAIGGGVIVTGIIYVGYHAVAGVGTFGTDLQPAVAALALVQFLLIYVLLYLQSGSLGLTTGFHAAGNYAFGVLFITLSTSGPPAPTILQGTAEIGGVVGTIVTAHIPEVTIGYLIAAGWLRVVRGEQLEVQFDKWFSQTTTNQPTASD